MLNTVRESQGISFMKLSGNPDVLEVIELENWAPSSLELSLVEFSV